MHVMNALVTVVAFCCIARLLCESFFVSDSAIVQQTWLFKRSAYLNKSKSQRLRTSSRTERFRCGKSDDNISIAFCETSGDLDVEETDAESSFLQKSSDALPSESIEPECSIFGSVTVIPNIFPGGNASIAFPDSVEASRSAIASSTACCRFRAT